MTNPVTTASGFSAVSRHIHPLHVINIDQDMIIWQNLEIMDICSIAILGLKALHDVIGLSRA